MANVITISSTCAHSIKEIQFNLLTWNDENVKIKLMYGKNAKKREKHYLPS